MVTLRQTGEVIMFTRMTTYSSQYEKQRKRMKFRPSVVVDEVGVEAPTRSVKLWQELQRIWWLKEEMSEHFLCLPKQGAMARRMKGYAAQLWAQTGPNIHLNQWVFNATLDNNTNSYLCYWGKKCSAICTLCSTSRQTLLHVLNSCPTAMDLRRYSWTHDEVLRVMGAIVRAHLPPSFVMTVDLVQL